MPRLCSTILTLLLVFGVNQAMSSPTSEQQLILKLVHKLDYISVDYPDAVNGGKVVDQEEFAEQQQMISHAIKLSDKLSINDNSQALKKKLLKLQAEINKLGDGGHIAQLCRQGMEFALQEFKINSTPQQQPSIAQGRDLYQQHCVACHGSKGLGDGQLAKNLEPAPANFHDRQRQQHRSVFALYNTISLGVDGTAMPAFNKLNAQQRWSLAFYVSNFFSPAPEQQKGEKLWHAKNGQTPINNLEQLTRSTPAQLQQHFGHDGVAILGYLRATPQALKTTH